MCFFCGVLGGGGDVVFHCFYNFVVVLNGLSMLW